MVTDLAGAPLRLGAEAGDRLALGMKPDLGGVEHLDAEGVRRHATIEDRGHSFVQIRRTAARPEETP